MNIIYTQKSNISARRMKFVRKGVSPHPQHEPVAFQERQQQQELAESPFSEDLWPVCDKGHGDEIRRHHR